MTDLGVDELADCICPYPEDGMFDKACPIHCDSALSDAITPHESDTLVPNSSPGNSGNKP